MVRFFVVVLCAFQMLVGQAFAEAFDDVHPVYWNGKPPADYPVHGVDVARYQGTPNWNMLRAGGVSFAFIKATEGADFVDPSFTYNWNATARANVVRGAYHFYYFCSSPEAQAAWFIRNVPKQAGSLPPVIDVELNPDSDTCTFNPSAQQALDVITRFSNILENHYGQVPIIYTNKVHFYDYAMSRLSRNEFWLRSTAAVPAAVFPNQNWAFWQYSGTARISGVNGNIDANVFNGSVSDWHSWLKRRVIK